MQKQSWFKTKGRWKTPLPVAQAAMVPWIWHPDASALISPFEAGGARKRLSEDQAEAAAAMQDAIDALRREGRLPSGSCWIHTDGRPPTPIEAPHTWFKSRLAHFVAFRAG